MNTLEIKDALNNIGMPHLANKIESSFCDLSKKDVKEVINQIKDFDNYYKQGWKESETKQTLVGLIDDYVNAFRCYSILA